MQLILASASATRRNLLRSAGVDFTIDPADIDEETIRAEMTRGHGTAEGCARRLAEEKARHVSRRSPGATVIGADQILELGNEWLAKPEDQPRLRRQLLQLRGREHRQVSAVAVARDDRVVWACVEAARLKVRPFSEAFLAGYLQQADASVTGCVGGYQLEHIGVQLFEDIQGSYFTILGLPLLPFLDFLRTEGLLLA